MDRQDDIIDFQWPDPPGGARKGAQPGSPRGTYAPLTGEKAERPSAGTPALRSRLLWAQELPTADGTPYLRRWVLDIGIGSLRLHHWLCSDDDRAPHDHPYWMVTILLKGGYDDVLGRGDEPAISVYEVRRAPSIKFWPATHTHWVRVHEDGAWSLCVTGRQSRVWGFWQMRGDGVRRWVRSSRYFRRVGAHPCDR